MPKISFAPGLSTEDWLRRCAGKISEFDDTLSARAVADPARARGERPSCRVLEPEHAAALLFDNRLSSSRWSNHED
jgi:hypothetical protein